MLFKLLKGDPLQRIQRETLLLMRDQLAAFRWSDDEIAELVGPSMGIITGLPDLMLQLEQLRQLDLGTVPPASNIPPEA